MTVPMLMCLWLDELWRKQDAGGNYVFDTNKPVEPIIYIQMNIMVTNGWFLQATENAILSGY